MGTNGFGHYYVETHNWNAAVAFWQSLGYQLEFETDHHSGMLRHPDGGPTVFLAEQSLDDPLASEVYFSAPAGYEPAPGLQVVRQFTPTHWGTKVMVIQDPDGRRYRIEAPVD